MSDELAELFAGFRKFKGHLMSRICRCGHGEYHHRGFYEPGCSFAGLCECEEFELHED